MVRVEFLGPIKKSDLVVDIKTLRDLKKHLQEDETIIEWLNNSAVAVNNNLVKDLDFCLKDGDVVTILPPVCGG